MTVSPQRLRCRAWHGILGAVLMHLVSGCNSSDSSDGPPVAAPATPDSAVEIEPQVRTFCSGCHAFPEPATFPQDSWAREVQRGYGFYHKSGRTDLKPPRLQQVIGWYRGQAPPSLEIPPAGAGESPSPIRFERRELARLPIEDGPAVAHLSCGRAGDNELRLFACDMRAGVVWLVTPVTDTATPIARVPNPARLVPADLDSDGREDFIIADLGSFMPEDHARGAVWWLRQAEDQWSCRPLVTGLGRVCDAEPIDFDLDGDPDLVVAEFGWRETGRILLLEHQGLQDGVPDLKPRVLDPRHGTIHVPVVDFNVDGAPDFLALIGQEHEVVELFENQRNGAFQARRVFQAENPAFGSSGIEVVDLDGDGDLDVLYTNGDSLDSSQAKAYHAVRWLENDGRMPFAAHEVRRLPGVERALSGDLDGDGDLDIVAVSLLPGGVLKTSAARQFAAVIWLEQTAPREFATHVIEYDRCEYLTCALADWDGDGRLDLLVGQLTDRWNGPAALAWFRNLGHGEPPGADPTH
jgi:hypothetical protein